MKHSSYTVSLAYGNKGKLGSKSAVQDKW